MTRNEITDGVIGQIKVPVEVLAHRGNSLYVLLTLGLVLCVGDAGAVALGYVRPLEEQLMPVTRTAHIDSCFDDRVQGESLHLVAHPSTLSTIGVASTHHILIV
jgi:hypothetical protein